MTTAIRPDRCWRRLLKWAQGTFASKLAIDGDAIDVTREVDGGLQTVKLKMPAIITTDLRLNEPRYASLPNIMKAKKKPIEEKTPDAYGVDIKPRLQVLKTNEPPGRKSGVESRLGGRVGRQTEKRSGGPLNDHPSDRRARQQVDQGRYRQGFDRGQGDRRATFTFSSPEKIARQRPMRRPNSTA